MLKLTDYITNHKAGLAVEPSRWTDIQHDRVSADDMALGQAEADMRDAMESAEFDGQDGVDLGREVFASLYEGDPMESEKPEQWATTALDIAKSIPEWEEMLAYTQGDKEFSAIGAADILDSIREQVIDMRTAYQQHQDQQDGDDDQNGDQQGGDQQGGAGAGQGQQGDGEAQGEAQGEGSADGNNGGENAANAGGQVMEDGNGGEQGEQGWEPTEEQQQAMRDAMRQAIRRTVDEVGELSETLRGCGDVDGAPVEDDTDRSELIKMIRNNRRFNRLLKMAGRITQMPAAKPARTDADGYDAKGVEESGDIAAVLPSELAMLADAGTELLFYKKIAEEKLLTVKRAGKKPMGRGDLIIALDESGSMEGSRYDIAQAMTMAAVINMRKDGRNASVIGFGSNVRGETDFTKYSTAKHNGTDMGWGQALGQLSRRGAYGGTRIDVAIRAALRKLKHSPRADLMVLTDGDTNISGSLVDQLNTMKKNKGVRVTVVIVGGYETPAVTAVADTVIKVEELTIGDAAKAIGKARAK